MQHAERFARTPIDDALCCLLAGVQQLVNARNFQAHVEVDGQEAEGEVAAITVANAAPPFSVLAHGHTGECIYDGECQAWHEQHARSIS